MSSRPLNALELKILLKNLRESDDAAKSEMKHQKNMKREISKLSAGKEKDLEEAGLFGGGGGEEEEGKEDDAGGEDPPEEGGDDKSGGDEEKPKDEKSKGGKEKGGKLPGAKKLAAASKEPDEEIKSDDVIARLNFIRAGKSLKDKEVSSQLKKYIETMSPDERKAFFAFSDGIAKIVLGGEKAVEVPSPLDTYSIKISSSNSGSSKGATVSTPAVKTQPKTTVGSAPPIVVGEGVKTKMKEIDVPVKSGRVVPFGSKAHISDLEDRIEDIERIRSYQEPGSESRQALTMAL